MWHRLRRISRLPKLSPYKRATCRWVQFYFFGKHKAHNFYQTRSIYRARESEINGSEWVHCCCRERRLSINEKTLLKFIRIEYLRTIPWPDSIYRDSYKYKILNFRTDLKFKSISYVIGKQKQVIYGSIIHVHPLCNLTLIVT